MLANRLLKRFRHLAKWAKRTGLGAFRLYDRDIPEIPLLLDYYGDAHKPEDSAIAGALYKRPYEKDDAEEELWLSAMKNAVSDALGINQSRIFLKQRQRQRGAAQYEKTGSQQFTQTVRENNLCFKVNLSDYLDSGLFLDRRPLRAIIRVEAAGKRVLNLFSYTGSFSVYAAAGGAVKTDSVDLSNTYQQWAKSNFSLNNFKAEILRQEDFFVDGKHCKRHTGEHSLITADTLSFLAKAAAQKLRWDHIILDPPAFSNSKKMSGNFDLRRDHIELLALCLGLLAPGGKLWFSVNTRQFKPTAMEMETKLALHANGVRVTDIANKITDEDFKGKKIPGSFVLETQKKAKKDAF